MRECSGTVKLASPYVRANGQIIVGNENWSPNSIKGGNEHYLDIEGWTVQKGRAFTKKQVDEAARVCLIGNTIAEKFFSGKSPVGQDVRIKDVVFTIIGVLKEKGANMMGFDEDDVILAPWTTVRLRITGLKTGTVSNPIAFPTFLFEG